MNFTSVFEELSGLYEDKVKEAAVEPAFDEVTEDSATTEEPKQVILECSKCGALAIKDEADVVVDADTDLANVDEACQYCEEAEGYKIVGVVAPYESSSEEEAVEDDEIVEESLPADVNSNTNNPEDADNASTTSQGDDDLGEGIFGFGKKKKQATQAKAGASSNKEPAKVTYSIYNEHGTKQFSHTFTELPNKQSALDQLGHLLKNSYPGLWNQMRANKSKWQYEKHSVPKQYNDTDNRYNYYLNELHFDGFMGF